MISLDLNTVHMVKINKCPKGYQDIQYNPSPYCYKLLKETSNYNGAKAICQRYGAKILELNSVEETRAIERHLKKLKTGYAVFAWLGLQRHKTTGWKRESGTKNNYSGWYKSIVPNHRDCAFALLGGSEFASGKDGKWRGANCSKKYRVLCMKKGRWKA